MGFILVGQWWVCGGRGGCGGFLFWVFGGNLWLVAWVIVVAIWWWWRRLSFGGWLDLGCFVMGLGFWMMRERERERERG